MSVQKGIISFLFFVLSVLNVIHAQTIISYNGQVSNQKKAVSNVNIIAKPSDKESKIVFATTNATGNFDLKLQINKEYQITFNHSDFQIYKDSLYATKDVNKEINLVEKTEILKEIVIDYVRPIETKKDTIIYNLSSFTNGDERKLKDELNKLPGVEVDESGNISVNGKMVSRFFLDKNLFFGGNSQLASKNIPSGAVDKVEVLDHFSDIGFMKDVVRSDELVMNVTLKEDKKQFVFGEIESGLGNQKFYNFKPSLFYYHPKINIGLIGSINNLGTETFSVNDAISIDKGYRSNLFKKRNESLFSFIEATIKDINQIKNQSRNAGLNFQFPVYQKFKADGLFIADFNQFNKFSETHKTYFHENIKEFVTDEVFTKRNMFYSTWNLKYQKSKSDEINYKIDFKMNELQKNNLLNSISNVKRVFNSGSYKSENVVSQLIDYSKKWNNKNYINAGVRHYFSESSGFQNWKNDSLHLNNSLFNEQFHYNIINQDIRNKNKQIDFELKYYYILNTKHKFEINIGNYFDHLTYFTNAHVKNRFVEVANQPVYLNDVKLQLNKVFTKFNYVFEKNFFLIDASLNVNRNSFILNQTNYYRKANPLFFNPELLISYALKKHIFEVSYSENSLFNDISNYANNYVLNNYNSVLKGDSELNVKENHWVKLDYVTWFKKIKNSFYFSYNLNKNPVQYDVNSVEVFQNYQLVNIDKSNENFKISNSLDRKFRFFDMNYTFYYSENNYYQKTANELNLIKQANYNTKFRMRTWFKEAPNFKLGYSYQLSNFKNKNDNFNSFSNLYLQIDYKLIEDLIMNFSYNLSVSDYQEKVMYQNSNFTLNYSIPNSNWFINFSGSNIFDSKFQRNVFLNQNYITDETHYQMPSIFMLQLGYKF